MTTWDFRLFLSGTPDSIKDWTNALVDAGCDDASMCFRDGHAFADFHRDAETLQAAIRSALDAVRSCGYSVDRIELDPKRLAPTA